MRKLVLLLGLLLLPTTAFAVGPNLNHCLFTWTVPPVPSNDLAFINVYVGVATGGPYVKVGTVPATSSAGNQTYAPTTNFCTVLSDGQKYAMVKLQDTIGNESGPSNEVPFVIDTTAPPSATNLTVH